MFMQMQLDSQLCEEAAASQTWPEYS